MIAPPDAPDQCESVCFERREKFKPRGVCVCSAPPHIVLKTCVNQTEGAT